MAKNWMADSASSTASTSNIQDGSVVHIAHDCGTEIGELVTVGHKAVIHACNIADEVLVGIGAIVLDCAEIGARSIIGAGAVVTGGRIFTPGSLILSSPAKTSPRVRTSSCRRRILRRVPEASSQRVPPCPRRPSSPAGLPA